jgi:beta-lactam-binding protein with PASTA domain
VVTLGVGKTTDAQPSIVATKSVIPDVRCRDLQTAQDALRAAGYYVLVPKDGLGKGRLALVDRNWIVIGQSSAPGSSPEVTSTIELTVVKYGDPTGNSGCAS